ncbi:hypothetical protein U1Q18_009727 [Sarracenia purpurea var. burkii]
MLWTTRYERTTGPRPVNKPKPNADLDPTFATRLGIDLRADAELRDQIKRRPRPDLRDQTGDRPKSRRRALRDLDPTFATRLGIDLRADAELRDHIKRRPSSPDTDPETRSVTPETRRSLVPPIRRSTARVAGLRPPFSSPHLVLAADGRDLATGAAE